MAKGFRPNSSRINNLEDSEGETRGTHFGMRQKGDTFDDLISVEQLQPSQLGSRKNPSSLEVEVKMPISVEEYDEDMAFKIAVAKSLCDVGSSSEVEVFDTDPDDPKGKKHAKSRTLQFAGEAEQVERSSEPLLVVPNIDCGICMESKFGFEIFFILGCSHFYCTSCVSQYVKAKVEENVIMIGCPDPGCKEGFLDPDTCQLILAPEVFARWGKALCESMIGESKKFYCPYKDCSALLIAEGGDGGKKSVITTSECPHCHRLFCAQCKVPWHSEVSCKEFQALGADERGKEDLMLRNVAKACKWQRCPKCKFYVEKIDGCLYMKCRCGHAFCYVCASTLGVKHYCSNCKKTWI